MHPLLCPECGEDEWTLTIDPQTGGWRMQCPEGHFYVASPNERLQATVKV